MDIQRDAAGRGNSPAAGLTKNHNRRAEYSADNGEVQWLIYWEKEGEFSREEWIDRIIARAESQIRRVSQAFIVAHFALPRATRSPVGFREKWRRSWHLHRVRRNRVDARIYRCLGEQFEAGIELLRGKP